MQYLAKQRLALRMLTIVLAPRYGQTGVRLDTSFGTGCFKTSKSSSFQSETLLFHAGPHGPERGRLDGPSN